MQVIKDQMKNKKVSMSTAVQEFLPKGSSRSKKTQWVERMWSIGTRRNVRVPSAKPAAKSDEKKKDDGNLEVEIKSEKK